MGLRPADNQNFFSPVTSVSPSLVSLPEAHVSFFIAEKQSDSEENIFNRASIWNKMAQAVTLLTCVWTILTEIFRWFCSASADSALKLAAIAFV
jgi:hypothetical protein